MAELIITIELATDHDKPRISAAVRSGSLSIDGLGRLLGIAVARATAMQDNAFEKLSQEASPEQMARFSAGVRFGMQEQRFPEVHASTVNKDVLMQMTESGKVAP